MNALLSPGSLITLAGAALTVIGSIAYLGDNANLSLPTIFYGIPILLGGLALKSSELPPPLRLTPPAQFAQEREQPANADLKRLRSDLLRWRYGQKAHLESSLEALKLWNEDEPPQLLSLAETTEEGCYGLELTFRCGAVPIGRWQDQNERLGRFFGPGLCARVEPLDTDQLRLTLRTISAPTPTPQP